MQVTCVTGTGTGSSLAELYLVWESIKTAFTIFTFVTQTKGGLVSFTITEVYGLLLPSSGGLCEAIVYSNTTHFFPLFRSLPPTYSKSLLLFPCATLYSSSFN